jgi:hypothetical protein
MSNMSNEENLENINRVEQSTNNHFHFDITPEMPRGVFELIDPTSS